MIAVLDHQTVEQAQRLSAGLGLDPASIDLFTMALESEFQAKLGLAHDLFGNTPNELAREVSILREEVEHLILHFSALEEWERCAALRDLLPLFS